MATALGTSFLLDVRVESLAPRVYLDANATTPLDDRVAAVMLEAYRQPTNAGSAHSHGERARHMLATARDQVAELFAARSSEIIFTSGATEANALAVFGVTAAAGLHGPRTKIVVPVTEHPAVLRPLQQLATTGWEIAYVSVGSNGEPSLSELAALIDEQTLLVTVMAANNEIGTLAPMPDIADMCRRAGAILHSDATQLAVWGSLDVEQLGVDLMSISAHKMHGPQGSGALYVSRELLRERSIHGVVVGGGQEQGLRGGTVNVPGAIGFGCAAAIATAEGPAASAGVAELRDLLERQLQVATPALRLNGSRARRLPGTLNVSFGGTPADAIMAGAPDVSVSTGSACASGVPGPSYVLKAMGITDALAESSLRFSLSRMTTEAEILLAAERISASARRVQHLEEEVA